MNDIVKDISLLQFNNINNINITNNNLLFDDINVNFDIIYFDLPTDIHNIHHANCCNKIKQLKIRGTSSEPLFLQYIAMSLNNDGLAIVVVPTSFLYIKSKQFIETRKFLTTNFNIVEIINLDEKFYYYKNVKTSVIIFKNSKTKTTNIKYSLLNIKDNTIDYQEKINLNIEQIKNNNFLLCCKLYNNSVNSVNSVNNSDNIVSNLFNISNEKPYENYISISKYIKNKNSICINNQQSDCIYLYEKKNNNMKDFCLYYLYNYLINNIDLITKGIMKQYDINKINNIKIYLFSNNIQQTIVNYYSYRNTLYNTNLKQIEIYKKLKKNIMQTLSYDYVLQLNDIGVCFDINNTKYKSIGIIKNSLSAGKVYWSDDKSQTNSYYLEINNDNFLIEYVYYYLKFIKNKLKNLANLTSQSNLLKKNLLELSIPVIDINIQKEIVNYCKDFDNFILKFKLENENLNNKDIITLINKLYVN
jgi:restriction endonuclease S subunit